jgi:two-component system, NtrC family, response regulator HydG
VNTEGGKILMIDDDEDVLLAAKMLLKKQGHHIIIEKNPKKIPFLLNNDTYDVILLDMNFSKEHVRCHPAGHEFQ